MLKKILMFLFSKSQSRVDMYIIVLTVLLFAKGEFKEGILLALIGGLMVALIESILGIRR